MILRRFLWAASTSIAAAPLRAILGLAAATLFLVLLVTVSEVRLISASAFCLLGPGYGWARRLPGHSPGDTLAMAVLLSICATILTATVMAVFGIWSALAGFGILVLFAITGWLPLRRSKPAHRRNEVVHR